MRLGAAGPRRLKPRAMSLLLLPELVPPTLEELAPKPDEDAWLKEREAALKVSVSMVPRCRPHHSCYNLCWSW